MFDFDSFDGFSFDDQNGGPPDQDQHIYSFPFDDDGDIGLTYSYAFSHFEYRNEVSTQPMDDNVLTVSSFQFQHIPNPTQNMLSNIAIVQGSTSRCSTRAPKRKVDLSKKSELFKSAFYKIFTNKSKFPKKLVKEIHEYIRKFIKIPKMSREHIRRIDLYFEEFSNISEIILSSLQNHREELLDAIPELFQLK